MSVSTEQNQSLDNIIEKLRSMEGVEHEVLNDGRIALEISYGGECRKVFIAGSADDYRALKLQYSRIRDALTELGIKEGMEFVAARRSRRPLSQEMLAAAAKKKKEFDAWQELWRIIREAEKSLDIEFEFNQMRDYY